MRNLIIPAFYNLKGSKQLKYLEVLQKSQKCSFEEQIKMQKKNLLNIIKHAVNNVPYYNKLNIDLENFAEETIFEDIKNIPFLDKNILRKEFESLQYNGGDRKTYYNTSGGSTGEAARFIQDDYYSDWNLAASLLFDSWTGYQLGEPTIQLWAAERDIVYDKRDYKHLLAEWIRNRKLLNAFKMTEDNIIQYIEQINMFKPKLIVAFVNSIYELALYAFRKNIVVHSPKGIIVTAETLYEEQREIIQKVFNCQVFNRYGSREIGAIACECEKQNGLHINIFNQFIEVVNDDGKSCDFGEEGNIVVTNLKNYSMPIIRFKIGDRGVLSDRICECGRNLPLFDKIIGRTNSFIRTRKGTVDAPAVLSLFLYKNDKEVFESFSKFQIIQEEIDKIVIKVKIEKHDIWQKEKEILRFKFSKVFNDDTEVIFQEVEEIDSTITGKRQLVISKV